MEATRNFEFSWPILKVVLEGASILDVPRLQLRSMEESTSFIQAYGFDTGNAADLELLWQAFDDSIGFIERSLTDPEYPKIPEHLRTRDAVKDVRRLLLLASESTSHPDQIYACAILRVMHILIHLTHDLRIKYFDQVQNQILGRLDSYLYVDPNTGATYLGDQISAQGIKLLFFKKKDRKDRDREIIKLLHKTDSLVEEIYDRLGFRLVTETKFDTVRAVKLLLEKNIISVPNIRPGRSRNRLVDLSRLEFEVDRIITHMKKNEGVTAPYVEKMIKRLESRIGLGRSGRSLLNPHSSEHYKAIQFTCRELVKVRNPLYQLYQKLRNPIENLPGGQQVLQEVFQHSPPADEYVFFPYEIQIMDVRSYADSIFGRSNHEEYRKKQLEAARHRVFGRPQKK